MLGLRGRLALALVCTCAPLLVLRRWLVREAHVPTLHEAIEEIEKEWREGPGHRYIQELANQTLMHQDHWRPWAIIYVHVPRTGGDALYTHLFPTDDAYLGDAWWGEAHLPRFYDELKAHGDFNWSSPRRRALYKGFISGADLQELRGGPWKDHWSSVRMFTILRDPVERAISSIKHVGKNGVKICDRRIADYLRAHSCSGMKMLEEKLKSYLHNEMAFQLGDRLNVTLRQKTPEEAVDAAKELLRAMDFIGFYEDWQQDYYRLRETIFHDFEAQEDGPHSPMRTAFGAFRRWIFYMGTIVARPRMRTRKYAAQVTSDDDWRLLREHTRYDQEVYDFARELTGRPTNPFYNNYGEFLLYEGPFFLAWTVPFLLICGYCCVACLRRCTCLPRITSARLSWPEAARITLRKPKEDHVA